MNIADIFRWSPKPAVDQPKPVVADPSKPADPNAPKVGEQVTAPAAFPKPGEGEKSPLDGYAKLWDNDPNAPAPPSLNPTLTADPAALMKAAKSIDFSKVLSSETLEAAMKDPTGAALATAINQAAQAGYAQSAHATTKIVEAALQQQAKMFKEEVMPDILRRHASTQAVLQLDNPVFLNPAVKPIVDLVKEQVIKQYRTATPAEIAKHTTEMLQSMSTEIAKASGLVVTEAPKDVRIGGARKDQDWEKFFEDPSNPVS